MSSSEAPEGTSPSENQGPDAVAAQSPQGKLPLAALLVSGCLGLGLYAAFGSSERAAQSVSAEPRTAPVAEETQLPPGHPSLDGATEPRDFEKSAGAAQLGGTVLEVIQVANYTYLRLAPQAGQPYWAAVPKTNVPAGSVVSLEGAELMNGFTSKELGRTFDSIYFARLGSGAGIDPRDGGDFSPPTQAEGEAARKAAAMVAEEVPVRQSQKAAGPLGRSVEEVYQQRSSLVGKRVRVRGTVVKVTRRVMGTNFVHVRDGSGQSSLGTHDVTLKVAEDPPALGEEAEFEGTVVVDVDLGAGYAYPLLLESATLVQS